MSISNNTTKLQSLMDKINALPEAGVSLPELLNPADAAKILTTYETIDENGEVVTGTMPNNGAVSATFDGIDIKAYTVPAGYTSGGTVSLDDTIDNEVDVQAGIINQIASVLQGKAGGSGNGAVEFIEFMIVYGDSTNPNELICKAEKGMSFGAWVCSDYNPIYYGDGSVGSCGLHVGILYVQYTDAIASVNVTLNGIAVHPKDKIEPNVTYQATYVLSEFLK